MKNNNATFLIVAFLFITLVKLHAHSTNYQTMQYIPQEQKTALQTCKNIMKLVESDEDITAETITAFVFNGIQQSQEQLQDAIDIAISAQTDERFKRCMLASIYLQQMHLEDKPQEEIHNNIDEDDIYFYRDYVNDKKSECMQKRHVHNFNQEN